MKDEEKKLEEPNNENKKKVQEMQIRIMCALGASNAEIAQKLNIAIRYS